MQDLFYTILVVWLIWKISNSFKSSERRNTDKNNNYKSSGEVKVTQNPKNNNDDGEYVDYEEMK